MCLKIGLGAYPEIATWSIGSAGTQCSDLQDVPGPIIPRFGCINIRKCQEFWCSEYHGFWLIAILESDRRYMQTYIYIYIMNRKGYGSDIILCQTVDGFLTEKRCQFWSKTIPQLWTMSKWVEFSHDFSVGWFKAGNLLRFLPSKFWCPSIVLQFQTPLW